jgi:hypothetical protein
MNPGFAAAGSLRRATSLSTSTCRVSEWVWKAAQASARRKAPRVGLLSMITAVP